jgi:hypothetical protein
VVAAIVMVASSARPAQAGPYAWTSTPADPAYGSGFCSSIAIDGLGHPRIAEWATSTGVRLATFDGAQWTAETVPAPPSAPAFAAMPSGSAEPAHGLGALSTQLLITTATSLALGPADEPWIAWLTTDQHNSVAPVYPVQVSHRAAGAWSTESLEPGVWRPAIAVDAAGSVHVCYAHGTTSSHDLRYALRQGGAWTYETIASGANEPALVLDAQGVPHVAYRDEARNAIVLAVRNGAAWDTTTVPTPNHPAGFALALDANGQARIAEADYTIAYQTTIQFLEQQGSSWQVSAADPSLGNKSYLSVAIDAGGNPVIAYGDGNGYDLVVSSRLAGTWSRTVVDANNDTGSFTSVAIDGALRPWVSYQTSYGYGSLLVASGSPTWTTSVPGGAPALRLAGPGPNPAHCGAPLTLSLELPAPDRVGLELFDLAGRLVAERAPRELAAGRTSFAWNPALVHPGLYLLRVTSKRGGPISRRLAVVR